MKDGTKLIDVHNRSYAKAWLDYLAKRPEEPTYEWTGPESGVFKIGGIIAGHTNKAGDYDLETIVADLGRGN